jgi:molybdenum cofactor biosynthesis enzyme MoaA
MRPRILRPTAYYEVELDGFDPSARARFDKLVDKLKAEGNDLAFLQYGFQFKRGQVHEEVVHDSMDAVRERVLEDIRRTGNPARAIIEGVDDAWEISILKFSFEMILRSHEINAFDFKRRGLI